MNRDKVNVVTHRVQPIEHTVRPLLPTDDRLEAEHGRKVLMVAADVARPGAIEQLQVLGEQVSVPVFAIPGGDPVDICDQARHDHLRHRRSPRRR